MRLLSLPRLLLHSLAFLSALTLGHTAQGAEPPPISAFTAEPEIRKVKVSPDGKYVILVSVHDFVDSVATLDLATMQVTPLISVKNTKVLNFWWKGPERIVFLLEEVSGWSTVQILNLKTRKQEFSGAAGRIGTVVNSLPADPAHVLITDYRGALKRFNVLTGKSETLEDHQDDTFRWLTNADGQALAALGVVNSHWFMLTRSAPGTQWQRIELGNHSLPDFMPLAVARDQRRLIGWDYSGSDIARVVVRDPATKNLDVVFPAEEVDPSSIVSWGDDTGARGVRYVTDRPRDKYVDEKDAALARTVDSALPDTFNSIASASIDETKFIVVAESDNQPPTYYLFDRTARRMSLLGSSRPNLNPQQLGKARYFHFTATDGLPLTGRILLPPPTGMPPPLLVFIAFDLTDRSSSGFDAFYQLCVSRGYAVLEVNQRGVDGFGQKHANAGVEQVNGKMGDDVAGGIAYVTKEGWVDGKRVAMVGAGAGGMLGLFTLSRHPELFAAWVNFNTPLTTRYLRFEYFSFGRHEKEGFSLPVAQEFRTREYVRTLDPAARLKDIKVPSFHYYDTDYSGQPVNDGDKAARVLRKAGLPVTFLIPPVYATGANQLETQERDRKEYNRMLEEMLKFLATYLPPAGQTSPASTPAK